MGERRGLKALELWCKRVTEGYPGVKIDNMTTSWRDGLGFCAIINHFRPDLIDFSKLNKDDILRNNELAFRIAQQYLGIPALLDAEDMVEYTVPDRLSILTYLSQFYNALACQPGSTPARATRIAPSSTSTSTKMAIRSSSAEVTVEIPRREPCVKCKLPVFLVERVIVGKQLYHSSCFRCARCDNQLTAGNYYETDIKDQFCCETCPNEEPDEHMVPDVTEISALAKLLSDEEKSIGIYGRTTSETNISEIIECDSSEYSLARSHFMQELITDKNSDMEVPPPIPKTQPPDAVVAADNSIISYDSEMSDGYVPDTDSLKLSVNSCDKLISSDIKTNVDIITKENNENVKPLIDSVKSDQTSESFVMISDESVIVIEDDDEPVEISDDCIRDISLVKEEQSSLNPFDGNSDDEIEDAAAAENETDKSSKSLNSMSDEEEPEAASGVRKKLVPRWSEFSFRKEITLQRISVGPQYTLNPQLAKPAYAPDMNPFSSDEDEPKGPAKASSTKVNDSLNPFSDDEDEDPTEIQKTPPPRLKKVVRLRAADFKISTGSSTGDTPATYKKPAYITPDYKKKSPPRISLNPFSSDEDEPEVSALGSTNGTDAHIPKSQYRLNFGSSNSIASTTSASSSVPSTLRKKKPAPKPPIPFNSSAHSSPQASITSSPSTSAQQSPRPRKTRRAPLAPTSTPAGPAVQLETNLSPVVVSLARDSLTSPSSRTNSVNSLDYEKEKVAKDEANRQTQSGHFQLPSRDKSTYGKWKRKKGQAPSIPVPQKRTVKALPITELKKELDIIDVQLQGLNKQGVRLEKIIRDQCEGPESDPDATKIPIEAEDLILQLFEVVNEKNELCRRQAELMYLKRQHRLEEEQAEIEYQIRCLMIQSCKTDSEKARETELIERVVEIVNLRAEIVECLEMDRVRTVEEDDSVACSMNTYAQKREEAQAQKNKESPAKKGKKKFKKKLLTLKRFAKLDVDKDIDESETRSSSSSSKSKGKKKN